jgi:polysaccharide deacetylase 2 family uncharacterized protein YibQ
LTRPIIIAVLLAAIVFLILAAQTTIRKEQAGTTARKYLAFFLHKTAGAQIKNPSSAKHLPIEDALYKNLLSLECRASDIKTHSSSNVRAIVMQAMVPRGRPFEWVISALSHVAEGTSYEVSDCVVDERKPSACITFAPHAKNNPVVTLTIISSERYYSGTARMALIVENLEDTSYQIAVSLLSYPEPLTVSIIPGSKKAALIAQLADQHQKEVIIRMPFESQGSMPASVAQSAIMVHFSKDAINAMVGSAVHDIPNFTGFTNAWGSRACEDSRIMNIILANIRKQHGYFIETRTTKNSVAASVATALDCPFSEVNARIEKRTAPDIAAELRRLGAGAQANGTMAASVTASKQLADALADVRAWFRQNGIKLVFVSEIVKHPHE